MRLPKLRLRQLRWVAFGVAYLFAFVILAYVSFPYDRLKQHLVSTYNASQLGPTPDRLEVESLTWSWRFPGVVARGVRLTMGTAEAKPAAGLTVEASSETTPPPPTPVLAADEVYVSFSPLSLLTGARAASFGAYALGGEVSGWARDSADL